MEQSTNISADPSFDTQVAKNISDKSFHFKKKFQIVILTLAVLLLILLTLFVLFYKNFQQNVEPELQSSVSLVDQQVKNKDSFRDINVSDQALISMVPNFDNLTIYDLPNFRDVREVFDYKGNKIISGIDRAVLFDPNNKRILWQNNTNVLRSIHSVALAGDYLYVASDRFPGSQQLFSGRKVLKIDLKTGKIIKSFFENDERKLINLRLFTTANYIWGNAELDGVFRLDPKNDEIEFYLREEARAISEFNDIYNEKIDKINLQLTDFNLDLATFMAISQKVVESGVSDKYFLFSKDEVYTLNKGEFPMFYKKINMFESLSYESKLFIDKDEKYALLVRSLLGGPLLGNETVDSTHFIVLMDLISGESVDLLKNNPVGRELLTSGWEKRLTKINYDPHSSFEEVSGGVRLIENDTKKEIFFVNLIEKKLEFR